MAFDRKSYKNRIMEYLVGALTEHYKATLARKNNLYRWVAHWETEVNSLLSSCGYALSSPVRGVRRRRLALSEVIAEVRTRDANARRSAESQIQRDFGLRRLPVALDDADTEAFWTRVMYELEPILQSFE